MSEPVSTSRHVDIVGDVHGCADELTTLLDTLGYRRHAGRWATPPGRKLAFIGDLADRGPRNVETLTIAMEMVDEGAALWVPGNHDVQLQRYLDGEPVPMLWGLDVTVAELDRVSPEFRERLLTALRGLPSHCVLDEGRLVIAHTGLPESAHGQESAAVRHLAAYGFLPGSPEPSSDWSTRHGWVRDYQGEAVVVYGHTPRAEAVWIGNTIDIDTGCVYGGKLTALQWPEKRLVQIPAARAYAQAGKLNGP